MENHFKNFYLKLSDEDKKELIKFVLINKPKGLKLRNLMEGETAAIPEFDMDLVDGQMGEFAFLNIATSGKHEIKRDFKASETGNIAVEASYNGRPSGIDATKSPIWVYWLSGEEYQDEVAVIITTKRLRDICDAFGHVTNGGDGNKSLLYLISIFKLLATRSAIDKYLKNKAGAQFKMF